MRYTSLNAWAQRSLWARRSGEDPEEVGGNFPLIPRTDRGDKDGSHEIQYSDMTIVAMVHF